MDEFGNLRKNGITYNPKSRYTKRYREQYKYAMDVVAGYEDRAHARMDERVLTEEMPGPLNKEPWAGAKQAIWPSIQHQLEWLCLSVKRQAKQSLRGLKSKSGSGELGLIIGFQKNNVREERDRI